MAGCFLEVDFPSRISEDDFQDACDEAFDYIVEITPVDEGYCQSRWENNSSYPTLLFENDCDYAEYLDDGWSKQAPNGMTRPTLSFVKRRVQGYE